MPSWKKVIVSGSSAVLSGLTLSGLSNQGSELTSIMINGSDVVGTRELSSTAFSTMDNYSSFTAAGDAGDDQTISSGNTLTLTGTNGITTTGAAGDSVDIALNAAQTGITSIYNAALYVGRDTHNRFDFNTDNVIKVSVNAVDDEFRFSAGGTFHADADVVAYSSTTASDMSLKENITDTKYGLDDIMKLRGVDFDWKREDMGRDVGVLAQEVEMVIPELVKEYDGMKGRGKFKAVDYNKLVPVLIESIKTLKSEIEILKKKVN